ncbi:MAG TPA: DNA primase [Kouleothrix sp.]|nr:DNA primase [Kouleothrix sp.]
MSTVIDTIKDRIDVVEFISAYVNLRKSGRNFVGFCPFHPNSKTPAFYVFPETQSYHCFGCKASGTVFDFLMQREGLDFRGALEQLAQRAGVQLEERTAADDQQEHLRTRLLDINAAAATFFQHMLVKSPKGEAARAYVTKRQINAETLESFQLGYSPDEWSALLGYLTDRKGFEPEEIEAAGLAIKRDQGGYYDRFRGRLMFPIRNVKGEIIAFGGRALGDAQPKYMNSPQTPLFDKSRVLYGLDLAREAVRASQAIVIVEGYVDVIIAHQYGFHNVVAPLGTALTSEHVSVVKKLQAKHVYLALDADAAGIRATLKGLQTLRDNLDGHEVPVPTPQGYIRWEREVDAEVRIIAMPDGKDPDEVIGANPEHWRALVAAARPAMDFYIDALTADLDLSSARGKAEAVSRLSPLVAQVVNPVEQAHHIQHIARLVQVEEHIIRQGLPRPERKATPAKPIVGLSANAPTQEDYMLGWLLRYPSVQTAVQEKIRRDLLPFSFVGEFIQGTLLELFARVENRAIWQAWQEQPPGTDPQAWANTLDDALHEHARRVLAIELPQAQAYRLVNDALECARMLQLALARRWKNQAKHQAIGADGEGEQQTANERLMQVIEYIDAISVPKRSSAYDDLHNLRAV